MKDYTIYDSPLSGRYAARAMRELFGPKKKFSTWRRIWLAVAESQKELGLAQISDEALSQMRAHLDDINFEAAEAREKEVRHDVMAHVHAWGLQAPAAAGVIHLGCTSCDITDNADLIVTREALGLVRDKLLGVIAALADFARREAGTPCLGATHFQVAQPVTVGKRATLWINDLLGDFYPIDMFWQRTPLRGVKGTTGTQASFLALFRGAGFAKPDDAVRDLDKLVCKRLGFGGSFPVTGQTYSRKVDHMILSALSGVGVSLHKFASDMRLLMGLGELEEPLEEKQIGSSAMAYKRNPMRSERICSLSRHLWHLANEAADMASQQWLERTLDDSAIRRVIMPEAFLTSDIVLSTAANVARGIVVNRAAINQRLSRELPFMATEEIIMEFTRRGGDRQHAHEVIRHHSHAVIKAVREQGAPNDLFDRLKRTPEFAPMDDFIDSLDDPRAFTGLAERQTLDFLKEHVDPLIAKHGRGNVGEGVNV